MRMGLLKSSPNFQRLDMDIPVLLFLSIRWGQKKETSKKNLWRPFLWLGDTRAHTQVPPCSCSSMGLRRGLRWPLFLEFFTKRAPLSWAATWGWLGEDLGLLVATLRWGIGEICLHLSVSPFSVSQPSCPLKTKLQSCYCIKSLFYWSLDELLSFFQRCLSTSVDLQTVGWK